MRPRWRRPPVRDLHEMEDVAGIGVRHGRDDELNHLPTGRHRKTTPGPASQQATAVCLFNFPASSMVAKGIQDLVGRTVHAPVGSVIRTSIDIYLVDRVRPGEASGTYTFRHVFVPFTATTITKGIPHVLVRSPGLATTPSPRQIFT